MGLVDFPDPGAIFNSFKTGAFERDTLNAILSAMYSGYISALWSEGASKWGLWSGAGQGLQDAATATYLSLRDLEAKKFLTLTVPKALLEPANPGAFFKPETIQEKEIMSSSFKGVIAKAIADAEKVKSAVAKAASDVDAELPKLEADAPEVEAVADALLPGTSTYINLGVEVLESLADILNKGDAAAEQNLKNAGLDEALIAAVKAQIANIEKLV